MVLHGHTDKYQSYKGDGFNPEVKYGRLICNETKCINLSRGGGSLVGG